MPFDFSQLAITRDSIEEDLPPVSGGTVLTTLFGSEIDDFVRIVQLEQALANIDVVANRLHSALEKMRQGGSSIEAVLTASSFDDEDEIVEYFKLLSEYRLTHARLWHKLRSNTTSWNSNLQICAGFTVVDHGKKITL